MRRTFFLLVLSGTVTAIGCGGNASSHDGVGTSIDRPFEKLTHTSSGGWMPLESIASECTPYGTTSVDSKGTCSFEGCVGNEQGLEQLASAQRQLTTTEMALVHEALSKVTIGSSGLCGADKGVETVTLESIDGTVAKYIDDFYSCNPAPEGETYVKNMDAIDNALYQVRPGLLLRTLPFDTLKLTLTSGMPMANAVGCQLNYVDTYTLDVSASTLAWDYCDTAVVQGSRVLNQSELESVARALAGSMRTYSGACFEDAPVASVAFTRGSEVKTFVDSTTGFCSFNDAGTTNSANLGGVVSLVQSLRNPAI